MFTNMPHNDHEWSEDDWEKLLSLLVSNGLMSYKDMGAAILGLLNPPQVGTSIASHEMIKLQYPPRKAWQAVRAWYYRQSGRCESCRTRLGLQHDHVLSRADYGDGAHTLDNIRLLCRRCNVARRPTHAKAGLTFLTTEAALMWILLVKRPTTYQEYDRLCRAYGLTMASIRFQEAWAMARWLEADGKYTIDKDSKL